MKRKAGGFLSSLIMFIIVAAIIVAAYRNLGDRSVIDYARDKSKQIDNQYKSRTILDKLDCLISGKSCKKNSHKNTDKDFPKSDTNSNTKSDKPLDEVKSDDYKESLKILEKISLGSPEKVAYDRKEWKHWSSAGSSCWNTREEALYQQATGKVELLDKFKKTTTDKSKACYIKSGKWKDLYSGETIEKAGQTDLDHVIPLGYASKHGGQKWTAKQKEAFANDLVDNLLIVSSRENRRKSDKGPSKYMPKDDNYHCIYAMKWIKVANKYGLTITKADKDTLQNALKNKCVVY